MGAGETGLRLVLPPSPRSRGHHLPLSSFVHTTRISSSIQNNSPGESSCSSCSSCSLNPRYFTLGSCHKANALEFSCENFTARPKPLIHACYSTLYVLEQFQPCAGGSAYDYEGQKISHTLSNHETNSTLLMPHLLSPSALRLSTIVNTLVRKH